MLNKRFFIIILLSAVFLAQAGNAGAGDWFWTRSQHHRNNHRQHRSTAVHPRSGISFNLGSLRFYLSSGSCYRRGPRRSVVVRPRCGAVIRTLPWGHRTVVINGDRYYTCGGTYYQRCRSGYVVVPDPFAYTACW